MFQMVTRYGKHEDGFVEGQAASGYSNKEKVLAFALGLAAGQLLFSWL